MAVMLSRAEVEAEMCRRDFTLFVKYAWHVIEPGTPLVWNWHLDALCVHLQATFEGNIRRLLINIAPGHAKSSVIGVLYPVWCWINSPDIRWLCASHSLDLAIRDNKNRRDLIESDWFQERYSHVFKLSSSQNVKSFFENDHRGYSLAIAVRSSGTGKRGSHLLIDDPNNAMAGEADIQAVKEWFGKTFVSRLNDQENGSIIVVGQRLHEQDLSGHLLSLGGWTHLNLPEEFEEARRCTTEIGWTDPRTVEGELLWPEKFPVEVLDNLKRSLGGMNYAAQYQQSPVPAGGGQVKSEWLRYYDDTLDAYRLLQPDNRIASILKQSCWTFATVDLAISSKQHADYTVIAFWAVTHANDIILFDLARGHMDNPEQQRTIEALNQRYRPQYIVIESVAYQLALIQQLLARGVPCREYKPVRDKVSRFITAAIWYENGKIYHPRNAAWLAEFENEILKFPRASHDDCADVVTMAAEQVVSPAVPLQDAIYIPAPVAASSPSSAVPIDLIVAQQRDPFAYADKYLGGGW